MFDIDLVYFSDTCQYIFQIFLNIFNNHIDILIDNFQGKSLKKMFCFYKKRTYKVLLHLKRRILLYNYIMKSTVFEFVASGF